MQKQAACGGYKDIRILAKKIKAAGFLPVALIF
jgi:hypothetical protein